MFGGAGGSFSGSNYRYDDLWEFSIETQIWILHSDGHDQPRPPARVWHAQAAIGVRLFIFGGAFFRIVFCGWSHLAENNFLHVE